MVAPLPNRRSKARRTAESRHGPHRTARALSCDQAYDLRYLQHRYTVSKDFQHKGTMLHAGQEAVTLDQIDQMAGLGIHVGLPGLDPDGPAAALGLAGGVIGVSGAVNTPPLFGSIPGDVSVPTIRIPDLPPQARVRDLAPSVMKEEAIARALAEQIRDEGDEAAASDYIEATAYYAQAYANDQFVPLWAERELEATVDELDPPMFRSSLPMLDGAARRDRDFDAAVGRDTVTARLDLMCKSSKSGALWVVDYKSVGPSGCWWKGEHAGKLKGWTTHNNEFLISWQALMTLHIARAHLAREGVKDPIKGFVIRRLTRQEPWDTDEWILVTPQLAYQRTPGLIRRAVRREHELIQQHAEGVEADWTGILTGACFTRYGACEYRPACASPTKEDFDKALDLIAPRPSKDQKEGGKTA